MKVTQEQIDTIVLGQYRSHKEAQELTGLSLTTISRIRKRYGVFRKAKQAEDPEQAIKLLKKDSRTQREKLRDAEMEKVVTDGWRFHIEPKEKQLTFLQAIIGKSQWVHNRMLDYALSVRYRTGKLPPLAEMNDWLGVWLRDKPEMFKSIPRYPLFKAVERLDSELRAGIAAERSVIREVYMEKATIRPGYVVLPVVNQIRIEKAQADIGEIAGWMRDNQKTLKHLVVYSTGERGLWFCDLITRDKSK